MRQCRKGHPIPEHEPRCQTCWRELCRVKQRTYWERNKDRINRERREARLGW